MPAAAELYRGDDRNEETEGAHLIHISAGRRDLHIGPNLRLARLIVPVSFHGYHSLPKGGWAPAGAPNAPPT
jgi:hypothetical protein